MRPVFIVIGFDTFEGPDIWYGLGAFKTFAEAKAAADQNATAMDPAYVYDAAGGLLYEGAVN